MRDPLLPITALQHDHAGLNQDRVLVSLVGFSFSRVLPHVSPGCREAENVVPFTKRSHSPRLGAFFSTASRPLALRCRARAKLVDHQGARNSCRLDRGEVSSVWLKRTGFMKHIKHHSGATCWLFLVTNSCTLSRGQRRACAGLCSFLPFTPAQGHGDEAHGGRKELGANRQQTEKSTGETRAANLLSYYF